MRRSGGYAMVLEAMGAEAAAAVSEAGSLARRHGHALVTPLHVASAILSSSSSTQAASGLLRLSGHHEDLKVSLDEALTRLPVACPVGAAPQLDLSNALVALLRRAKTLCSAGGGVRRRQVKIELEHLVAAILDDPSVHRAMRKPVVVCEVLLDRPVAAADRTFHSWDDASQEKTERASLPSWLQDAIHTCRTTTRQPTCRQQKFAQLSANSFKIMCEALELHLPQHQDIIPDIATTVLLCRSGLMRRRARRSSTTTTWLLFRGNDLYGKKAMAQELSKLIFGCSYTEFSLVNSVRLKRKRSQHTDDRIHVMTTLLEAILENPHRVVFIDGVNQLDYESEIAIKNLIATGCNGSNMVNLEDTIFVLSSDEASISTTSSASSPLETQEINNTQNRTEDATFSLDLNACSEDVEDEQYINVGIMSVVDGVFRFD